MSEIEIEAGLMMITGGGEDPGPVRKRIISDTHSSANSAWPDSKFLNNIQFIQTARTQLTLTNCWSHASGIVNCLEHRTRVE